jgi:hypothetical protein
MTEPKQPRTGGEREGLRDDAFRTERLRVQEITLDQAIKLLRDESDTQGRKFQKIFTMVRDPNDLTSAITVSMHERAM